MAFFTGIFLFVIVVGILDSRLPWPHPESAEAQP